MMKPSSPRGHKFKSDNIQAMHNNSQSELARLKQKLHKYQIQQKQWKNEKQLLVKNIALMQQQITKQKTINASLLKKSSHKRTCSDEHTIIFNQTNYSSYYPIVVMSKTQNWIPRANLRSHLDAVKVVHWQGAFLLSAGEDCLLKIWERDRLKLTVREHLAPVFTICGDRESVFTAGAEGVVREWSVTGFLHNGRPVSEGQFHEDSIWEMVWNEHDRVLVTSSAEGSLKIIQSKNRDMKQISEIVTQPETPTSITYMGGEKIACGFVEGKKITIYDLPKLKKLNQLHFQSKQQLFQTNKLLHSPGSKLLISGHEDRQIRFFDPSSGKTVKSLVAHSDSITSLCIRPFQSNQLISCSHDGSIRIWDMRKYKCVNDVGVHMRKYDQSLLCLAHSGEEQMMAVGGADGQIKLLCPEG